VAATMMRAGRMTTSLCSDDPVGLGLQLDLAWSRGSDDRATRPARTGLDPVAINDRNEHASQAPRRFAQAVSTVKPPRRPDRWDPLTAVGLVGSVVRGTQIALHGLVPRLGWVLAFGGGVDRLRAELEHTFGLPIRWVDGAGGGRHRQRPPGWGADPTPGGRPDHPGHPGHPAYRPGRA
jgi:hypothetical protein